MTQRYVNLYYWNYNLFIFYFISFSVYLFFFVIHPSLFVYFYLSRAVNKWTVGVIIFLSRSCFLFFFFSFFFSVHRLLTIFIWFAIYHAWHLRKPQPLRDIKCDEREKKKNEIKVTRQLTRERMKNKNNNAHTLSSFSRVRRLPVPTIIPTSLRLTSRWPLYTYIYIHYTHICINICRNACACALSLFHSHWVLLWPSCHSPFS